MASSPEHLSLADDLEVRGWMITSRETELLDATPAVTSNTFVDIRRRDTPPLEGFEEDEEARDADEIPAVLPEAQPLPEGEIPPDDDIPVPDANDDEVKSEYEPSLGPDDGPPGVIDVEDEEESPRSTKKRLEFEDGMRKSENARKRMVKSSQFFKQKEHERRVKKTLTIASSQPQTESVQTDEMAELPHLDDDEELDPVRMPAFNPETDPFEQAVPTEGPPPVEVRTSREEAEERAAKRLRASSPSRAGSPSRRSHYVSFLAAADVPAAMMTEAEKQYALKQEYYEKEGVSLEEFKFGVERNIFEDRIHEMQEIAYAVHQDQAALKAAKKGRKEIRLQDLEIQLQEQFTGEQGSDRTEWQGWLDKKACEVLTLEQSNQVRREKPELVVPTRWVRTNKNEGVADSNFKAKSRLVVQGFKDKALGRYRRDAPTASQIAESILLCICAFYHFIMVCKDVKNGYFCGKNLDREVYLEQPRGGLPGLRPGQLLRARKPFMVLQKPPGFSGLHFENI